LSHDDFEDTGPGNKGGFGYHGIGLAMRTYEALVNGAVTATQALLHPRPRKGESQPLIISAMLLRKVEEMRDHVPAFEDYERRATRSRSACRWASRR